MKNEEDMQVKKLAISLLTKMVYCWGGSPTLLEIPILVGTGINNPKQKSVSQGPKAKDKLKREPLEGFDRFIFEILIPTIFEIPTKIPIDDAQGKTVFVEIVMFHLTMHSVFKVDYINHLNTSYFAITGFQSELGHAFVNALAKSEKNEVKNTLKVSCFNRQYMQV